MKLNRNLAYRLLMATITILISATLLASCELWEYIKPKHEHSFVGNKCEECGYLKDSIGLAYKVNGEGTCRIDGIGTCTDKDVKIPEYIDGYKVTEIKGYAFATCQNLTSITIPKTVNKINYHGLYTWSILESLTVEEGNPVYHSAGNCLVETASKTLICGCKNSVIPADGSVTTIGHSAFSDCYDMASIVIPSGVTNIGNVAFSECTDLVSVVIPDSVTEIGTSTFRACMKLESIVIPNSVTRLDDYTFQYCKGLKGIVIPDSVTSIGDEVFYDCCSLTSIEFEGTKAQWNAISKGDGWNLGTGNYTVYCTDGDITK